MDDEIHISEAIQIEAASQGKSKKVRIKELENIVAVQMEAIARHRDDIAILKSCCAQVVSWGKAEAAWSTEVTNMLRVINWAALATAFPGGGGTNPPQTPPDWPF